MPASVPLMFEYQAVLTRPEHVGAAGLSAAEVEVLLDAIAAVAEPVHLAFLWRPAVRDPDDDVVPEAAVNGRADAAVTFNVRDIADAAARFGEGVALNQFINVAVAEKLSALRTESLFRERAARADIPKALDILKRAGAGQPPMKGDAVPGDAA